ncbi:MAG TPA: hypothetical protein DCY20_08750 [Firmicutes bacterium]|nr:hypothetical protein [Bacillota bacterium]
MKVYQNIKNQLTQISLQELEALNKKNDLRIDSNVLKQFHDLLCSDWENIMDETSLSLKHDILRTKLSIHNVSKFNELITTIKRNIIFNK